MFQIWEIAAEEVRPCRGIAWRALSSVPAPAWSSAPDWLCAAVLAPRAR